MTVRRIEGFSHPDAMSQDRIAAMLARRSDSGITVRGLVPETRVKPSKVRAKGPGMDLARYGAAS